MKREMEPEVINAMKKIGMNPERKKQTGRSGNEFSLGTFVSVATLVGISIVVARGVLMSANGVRPTDIKNWAPDITISEPQFVPDPNDTIVFIDVTPYATTK